VYYCDNAHGYVNFLLRCLETRDLVTPLYAVSTCYYFSNESNSRTFRVEMYVYSVGVNMVCRKRSSGQDVQVKIKVFYISQSTVYTSSCIDYQSRSSIWNWTAKLCCQLAVFVYRSLSYNSFTRAFKLFVSQILSITD